MSKLQLHQLLAIEKDRRGKMKSIFDETRKVFSNKKELFEGFIKTFIAKDVDVQKFETEQKELVTSVREKLVHTFESLADSLNLTLSKEETNSTGNAKAELIVDGVSYGVLSSTALLAIEGNIDQLLLLLKEIPTLDNTYKWIPNKDRDDVKDLENPKIAYKTQKKSLPIVLYEATKEHPAQVQIQTIDAQIGYWETRESTGKYTPREKTDILSRIEKLSEAVKTARAKANTVDIVEVDVATKLLAYVLGK